MDEFKPVPTRASKILSEKQASTFKAIIFEEPKAANKPTTTKAQKQDKVLSEDETSKNQKKPAQDDDTEFDIKRARHEVLRFAMNNQRVTKNKKKMEIFQAVKLGAKPPKKAHKNYKDFLEERKRLKNIREERKKFHMLGKNQTGAASVKCKSKTSIEKLKKKRAPVSSIDQPYGKVKPNRR